jgi:peptidoglycan/LPS O-acetylase OafA/YrhL
MITERARDARLQRAARVGEIEMVRPSLPALTSLRFFAALFVVIFHYRYKEALFPSGITEFGYQAVTFFFMLSGFILTYAHGTPQGLNIPTSEFFAKRVARIAPAYYFALVIALPSLFIKEQWSAAPFVLSMTQSWIPSFSLAWNVPAWSLSNEMFFYFCYPAFYWLALRVGAMQFLLLTVALLVAVTSWRGTLGEDAHYFQSYFPILNLPQFVLGLALGNLYPRGVQFSSAALVAGLTALALLLAYLDDSTRRLLTNTVLLSAIFGLIIVGAAKEHVPILSSRPLFILGDASYSIFILHHPLALWWNKLVTSKIHLLPINDFGLYLSSTLAISIATLYLVEKPGKRAILRLWRGANDGGWRSNPSSGRS